jgi:parallel beta-helix repeat protein
MVLLCPSASAQSNLPNTDNLAVYTDIPEGPVSGTWTLANSPFHVLGEITIPNDSTLTIQPGVDVVFMGHYKFNVQGRLLAIGTQRDSIRFSAADIQAGWHGIRFHSTPITNDTSKIMYCSFRYGKATTGNSESGDRSGGAMRIASFDKVLISNCLFDSNMNSGGEYGRSGGAAICLHSASPTIGNSTFTNNSGNVDGAILCDAYSNPTISNNMLSNNTSSAGGTITVYDQSAPYIVGNTISNNLANEVGGGILVEASSNPRIENNLIVNNRVSGGHAENWGGGICCYRNVEPLIIGNIIAHNSAKMGGGISCYESANPIILNNTISHNHAEKGSGIYCNYGSTPISMNNIIYGNLSSVGSQVCIDDILSDPSFVYCDIEGGKEGFAGPGAGANYTGLYADNIDADPKFLNGASDDFRLSDSSLCLGAGADSVEILGVWYRLPPSCFVGNARPSPPGSRPDIGACESLLGYPVTGLRYPHAVRFSRCGRDTMGITARVENPLGHDMVVVAILTASSGVLIDSVLLRDDGLHGDGTSADGLWGCRYLPRKDDTINVTVRTHDLTLGASLTTPNAATYVFTRGPILRVDTRFVDLIQISNTLQSCDTAFMVRNVGYGEDSVSVTLDYGNVTPNSAVAVSPLQFALAAGDSARVTFHVRPSLLIPQSYRAVVQVHSRFGFTQTLFLKVVVFEIVVGPDDVPESIELPTEFALEQNYPNPFNPSTTIKYELPRTSDVRLSVFDMLGRKVSVLVNERRDAGVHEVKFDGSNLASGVYLYRLTAGSFVVTRKLVLVR